ncbi:hypothetical protein PPRY_a0719 [Pseudoalteromonas prydzensis ACAM 620]|nr:hypothetical protein [Pseudoalteromonas prydzensis ACAM 620]
MINTKVILSIFATGGKRKLFVVNKKQTKNRCDVDYIK